MSKGNDTCTAIFKNYGTFPYFLQWILTGAEFKVWCHLKNNGTGYDSSKKMIARRCNITPKTVKKALWGLEMLQLIKPIGRDDFNTECYEMLSVEPLFKVFSPCWITEKKQKPRAIKKLKNEVAKYERKLKKQGPKLPLLGSIFTIEMEKEYKTIVAFSHYRVYYVVKPDAISDPLLDKAYIADDKEVYISLAKNDESKKPPAAPPQAGGAGSPFDSKNGNGNGNGNGEIPTEDKEQKEKQAAELAAEAAAKKHAYRKKMALEALQRIKSGKNTPDHYRDHTRWPLTAAIGTNCFPNEPPPEAHEIIDEIDSFPVDQIPIPFVFIDALRKK